MIPCLFCDNVYTQQISIEEHIKRKRYSAAKKQKLQMMFPMLYYKFK